MLDNYLKTSTIDDGASGHTLFWYANRELHQNHAEVMDFVLKVFGETTTDLGKAQKHFVTNINETYPQDIKLNWNYVDYINDIDEHLTPGFWRFGIDAERKWDNNQQYIEWLYFRRRQGFGKTKWKAYKLPTKQ